VCDVLDALGEDVQPEQRAAEREHDVPSTTATPSDVRGDPVDGVFPNPSRGVGIGEVVRKPGEGGVPSFLAERLEVRANPRDSVAPAS
jgi:hypothetical protein